MNNNWIKAGIFGPLRSIMYELFYIDNVANFDGLDNDSFNHLTTIYPLHRIQSFRAALEWAVVCHDFDFRSLLPDLPHTNPEIAHYLTQFHQTLEHHAANQGWPSATDDQDK